jgi:hypothetical protein
MADKNDIWVGNLQVALQQAQRYIFAGTLSMALFFLLDQDAPELLRSGDKVDIPHLGKVTPGIAAIVLFSAYFIFGLLANSAMRRIRKIASKIHDKEILDAVLAHFSIVTVESKFIRIIAALLAPALLAVGLFIEWSRGATPSPLAILVGLPLLSLPYLFLLYQLLKPIKMETSTDENEGNAAPNNGMHPTPHHDASHES